MGMIAEEVELAGKHANEKTMEGLLEWITLYQDDPSIVPKEGEVPVQKSDQKPEEESKTSMEVESEGPTK